MFFFISDTHFGHRNVLRLCNRPFQTIEEMNETIIQNWNRRVKNSDTVCIVGDLFFCCKEPEPILKRLHGKKRLIVGNHDSSWMSKVDCSKYFVSVDDFLQISDGAHSLTLCHYPLLSWKHFARSYMIHGHIHANTDMDFWPCIIACLALVAFMIVYALVKHRLAKEGAEDYETISVFHYLLIKKGSKSRLLAFVFFFFSLLGFSAFFMLVVTLLFPDFAATLAPKNVAFPELSIKLIFLC